MKELITEFKYDLQQSFEYSAHGEIKQASFIIVKMPTGRLKEQVSIIDQEFQKAMAYLENNFPELMKDGKDKKEESEEKEEKENIISKALAAGNSDLNKCYNALKKILTSGIGDYVTCKIDDDVRFGSDNFENMSMKDINNILGRYIESFL